jgi:hypothetical protein
MHLLSLTVFPQGPLRTPDPPSIEGSGSLYESGQMIDVRTPPCLAVSGGPRRGMLGLASVRDYPLEDVRPDLAGADGLAVSTAYASTKRSRLGLDRNHHAHGGSRPDCWPSNLLPSHLIWMNRRNLRRANVLRFLLAKVRCMNRSAWGEGLASVLAVGDAPR